MFLRFFIFDQQAGTWLKGAMRILLSLVIILLSLSVTTTVQASQQIIGTLTRDIHYNGLAIILENKKKYFLTCSDAEAIIALNKMSPGDLVIGTGTIDDSKSTLHLENMDYVGLQRALGLWHTDNGFVEFKNFSDLDVYSKVFENSEVSTNSKKEFKYSLTPGTGSGTDWVLFLSDSDSTTMGTFKVDRNSATIKVFDSKTGNIKQTIRLSKVSN